MTTTHVFLDTSSLRGIGKTSLAGRLLKRLVEEEGLILHVSVLVEHELASQVPARSITNSPRAAQIADWFDELGVVRHEICAGDAKKVFAMYFAGAPPFKVAKNRNDIPDAFIYVCVTSFAGRTRRGVHVLAADRALRDALESVPNIAVHRTLSGLVGAVNKWLPAGDLRTVCQEQFSLLQHEIKRQLVPRLMQANYMPPNLDLLEVGELEEPTSGNFDWADTEPLNEEVVSLPFYGHLLGATIGLRKPSTSTGTLDAVPDSFKTDLTVEAWMDVRIAWKGAGVPVEMDVRITDVDIDDAPFPIELV